MKQHLRSIYKTKSPVYDSEISVALKQGQGYQTTITINLVWNNEKPYLKLNSVQEKASVKVFCQIRKHVNDQC